MEVLKEYVYYRDLEIGHIITTKENEVLQVKAYGFDGLIVGICPAGYIVDFTMQIIEYYLSNKEEKGVKMNNEEMKKKFDSGDYIRLYKTQSMSSYCKVEKSKDLWKSDKIEDEFGCTYTYKLIHKKHEAVLNAWLLDDKLELFYISVSEDERALIKVDDFIGDYDETYDYQSGDEIFTSKAEQTLKELNEVKYPLVMRSTTNNMLVEFDCINGGIIKEVGDSAHTLNSYCNCLCPHTDPAIWQLMSEVKELNELEKWGFENKEGVTIFFQDEYGKLHGLADGKHERWRKTGFCLDNSYFNLTPIKKEWYEDKDNFPCIVCEIETLALDIAYMIQSDNDYSSAKKIVMIGDRPIHLPNYRLATEGEKRVLN